MPQRVVKQIMNAIRAAEYVILVPHREPDGDAIGSATALAALCEQLCIPYTIYCSTAVNERFGFLGYTDHITTASDIWDEQPRALVVVVDSSDPGYAGISSFLPPGHNHMVINIDHHATNSHYGDLNLVIDYASSTTEILYLFFTYNNIALTRSMATGLMTGLITDTGNFTNSGTSKRALSIASELTRAGANVKKIKEHLLVNKSISVLKLWGVVLSRLLIHPEHKIVYTYLTQEDIEKHGVSDEDVEGIANLLNHLNEGYAAMVLRENKNGGVKASLRTAKDDVDVSVIAQHFGGGGHRKAAGFSLEHSIEDAYEYIFNELSLQQLAFVQAV